MRLLFLFCLFLNFNLFNCDEQPKFEDTSDIPMEPSYKYDSDTERRFEEIKQKLQKDFSKRRANVPPNFDIGILDYDITPIDFFGTTAKIEQNEHKKGIDQKKLPKTTADNEGYLNYDITKMFWDNTPKIGETGQNTLPKFYIPTLAGHGVEFNTTTSSKTTADPWQIFDQFRGTSDSGLSIPDLNLEYPDRLKGLNITFKIPKLNIYTRPQEYIFTRPSYPFSVQQWTQPSPDFYPIQSTLDPTYKPGSPSIWIGPLSTLFPGLTAPHGFPTEYTTTKAATTTTKSSSSSISKSPRPPIPIPRSKASTVLSESRMSLNFMPESEDDLAWLKVKPGFRNRG